MEAIVRKPYTDRLLGTVHMAGDSVDLSNERFAELKAKGFVTEPPKDRPAAAAEAAAPAEPEEAASAPVGDRLPAGDIELMTVQELVSYIGRMGGTAPSKAKKAELVEIAKGL